MQHLSLTRDQKIERMALLTNHSLLHITLSMCSVDVTGCEINYWINIIHCRCPAMLWQGWAKG